MPTNTGAHRIIHNPVSMAATKNIPGKQVAAGCHQAIPAVNTAMRQLTEATLCVTEVTEQTVLEKF